MNGRLFLEWAAFLSLGLNPIELTYQLLVIHHQVYCGQLRSFLNRAVQLLVLVRPAYNTDLSVPCESFGSYINREFFSYEYFKPSKYEKIRFL